MNDSVPRSRAGSRFGPYQLIELLGRGGMGEVYRAEDTRKHRVVALKLISVQLSDNPTFRARMQREADAAGRLTEPHVVPIHDYGEIDGQFYVEMRLIEGTDLARLLKRSGPLGPARSVAIIAQVAAALDAAHAVGVTHRDVKPENILVTPDDFAYLVDFGLARAATDQGLTQSGSAVGTYNYMAPERFSGDEVTHRADVYSLACVLEECLTGAPPYRGETIERLITAHLMEPPPRPSQLRPGLVPPALDQVIARGMAKNQRERFSTAGDLANAAHDALTTAEQHQATSIMRHGEEPGQATRTAGAAATGGYHTAPAGYPAQSNPGTHPTRQSYPGAYPTAQSASGDYPTTRSPSGAYPSQSPGYQPPGHERPGYEPPSGDQTMVGPAAGGGSWRSRPGSSSPAGRTASPSFAKSPQSGTRVNRNRLLVAAVAVLLAVLGLTGYLVTRSGSGSSASGQSVLPFDGLNFRLSPGGLTLDGDGNVYITNQGMYGRVVKLAPGSNSPTVLPFSGLYEPQGVAVDKDGTVYVTDFNNRVVKLLAGSNSQTELPISGLNYPEGLTVDRAGNVYVADRGNNRVVKLEAGSNNQTDLPLTGLHNPDDVAIDDAGNIYVTDTDNNRVVKLTAGSNAQTDLPFRGLSSPWGVAVDRAGNVFVTNHENHRVLKLAVGTNTQTQVPFTGLNMPLLLAVDDDDNVYVADRGNNRVVKLAAG
ncbi:MAG TPA: protein kinase [Mycobacterium sp.]|nr:protein kinase [Mycobacterium sp.]